MLERFEAYGSELLNCDVIRNNFSSPQKRKVRLKISVDLGEQSQDETRMLVALYVCSCIIYAPEFEQGDNIILKTVATYGFNVRHDSLTTATTEERRDVAALAAKLIIWKDFRALLSLMITQSDIGARIPGVNIKDSVISFEDSTLAYRSQMDVTSLPHEASPTS